MWICPECGKSDYSAYGGRTTCIAWSRRYVDGAQINPDPNRYTESRVCGQCETVTVVTLQNGDIISQRVDRKEDV